MGGPPLYNIPFYRLDSYNHAVHRHDVNRNIEIGTEFKENNESYRSVFQIKHDAITRKEYFEKGTAVEDFLRLHSQSIDQRHIQRMSRLWYISALRDPIPSYTNIEMHGPSLQPLEPSGRNLTQFLLERHSQEDPQWNTATEWLNKIDPEMTLLRTPISGQQTNVETDRIYEEEKVPIPLGHEGTGIQNATIIISAIIFSPPGSVICIEEPENFLHSKSQEILVDLFNYATKNLDKQIIFSIHSWNMLLPFISDVGKGKKRGKQHILADPNNFSMVTFNLGLGKNKIGSYDLTNQKFTVVRSDFKQLWG